MHRVTDPQPTRAPGGWLGLCLLLAATAACGQGAWKPTRPVELILVSGPGSGPDRNVRILQKIWQDEKTLEVPIAVVNKPGGGGAVAYGYIHQKPGDGHALVLGGATLLSGAILRNGVGHRDTTPVARLTGEYIAIAVRSDSPVKTGRDLIDTLKKSPTALAIGLATAYGNINHQAIALALKASGVDLPKVRTIIFQSGGAALNALLGGHIDIVPLTVAVLKAPATAGQVRLVAITAPARLSGEFANIPTWKEQGINATASAWRMMIAPPELTRPQLAFWEAALRQATSTDEWKRDLEKYHLTDEFLTGAPLQRFLEEESATLKSLLGDLGLLK